MTFESNLSNFVTMNKDLSQNVKSICRRKGWQLKDLASKMGIDPAALTRALNGNPTLDTINKMATALGVSPTKLIKRQTDISGFVTVNGEESSFDSLDELAELLKVDITPRT